VLAQLSPLLAGAAMKKADCVTVGGRVRKLLHSASAEDGKALVGVYFCVVDFAMC
jgi:hypothetical protein